MTCASAARDLPCPRCKGTGREPNDLDHAEAQETKQGAPGSKSGEPKDLEGGRHNEADIAASEPPSEKLAREEANERLSHASTEDARLADSASDFLQRGANLIWLHRDERDGWVIGDEGGEFARGGDDSAIRYVRDLMSGWTGGMSNISLHAGGDDKSDITAPDSISLTLTREEAVILTNPHDLAKVDAYWGVRARLRAALGADE